MTKLTKSTIQVISGNPGKFGGELMQLLSEIRIQTHVWHLQTKVHSQHISLNDIYVDIVDLTDSIIEVYQGFHNTRIVGNMNISIDSNWSENKPTIYLKSINTKLEKVSNHKYMQNGSLVNLMDEIKGLINKTLYLLSLKH